LGEGICPYPASSAGQAPGRSLSTEHGGRSHSSCQSVRFDFQLFSPVLILLLEKSSPSIGLSTNLCNIAIWPM